MSGKKINRRAMRRLDRNAMRIVAKLSVALKRPGKAVDDGAEKP
ncbi:hypothetical protein [Neisseria wadsworthii]|uniref:Uncharacterized protein n=1 Tax=Neisseria wadsworthii 9715 TaxID=1030841 RepID=G4CPJ6_9NEIS|nr:hypothetical protein [Neisseria wadsworthii]EGZ47759.1 hypothetical protein HMPREF9370_1006 [Neisseria wadsworthii 9715]